MQSSLWALGLSRKSSSRNSQRRLALATQVDEVFTAGPTAASLLAIFLLMQTLVCIVLAENNRRPLLPGLLYPLRKVPAADLAAMKQKEQRAKSDAQCHKNDQQSLLACLAIVQNHKGIMLLIAPPLAHESGMNGEVFAEVLS